MNKRTKDLVEEIDGRFEEGKEFEGLVPVNAQVSRTPRAVFSIRLSPEELSLFSNAAKDSNMTLSDWLRGAAMAALAKDKTPLQATNLERARLQVEELAETIRKL